MVLGGRALGVAQKMSHDELAEADGAVKLLEMLDYEFDAEDQDKERKDKGKRHTDWRLKGSIKAVGLMQEQATKALVQMAAADQAVGENAAPRRTNVAWCRP